MIKSSIFEAVTERASAKRSYRLAGLLLLIIVPACCFLIVQLFESEIAALLMDLYPPSPRQGLVFYADMVQLASIEILWIGFFFLLTWIFVMYLPRVRTRRLFGTDSASRASPWATLILLTFFITTLLISFYTLEHFPNSSDEFAYIFQAEMFSNGKLWDSAHDLPDFFSSYNIAQHEGIRLSRFPPGWPLILSIAFELGLPPFLINPFIGLITLGVFYSFSRRFYGENVALWSLALLALSGFYIFNAASYFSHVSCSLVTLLFVYNVYLYNDKKKILYGILAGFFLSFVVITRYYTAVLIFAPFLIYLLYQHRVRAFTLFFWMALGSVPCMAYLFWYNYSITGNALLPVTMWAYQNEQLGFVKGHTFLKAVEHLIRWTLLFLYWCSPGLLILYLVFLWRKVRSGAERITRPEDYTFFLLAVGYFFYYEIGGNQYGPRFLFEAFPFLILFSVSKAIQTREKWALGVLVASLVFVVVKLPFIADRENRIVNERKDLYDLVEQQNIHNAVILVSTSTSPLRPMPAADLTRNDIKFSNDVLYALELPNINEQLIEYYPERSFYKYTRAVDDPQGKLTRIR